MAEAEDCTQPTENAAGAGSAFTRIVRLDSLELTYRASTKDAERLRRRFMTLSVRCRSGTA